MPDPNAFRAMMDEVERLGRPPMRPAAPRGRLLSRPPGSFALHRDPGGRFELSLPADEELGDVEDLDADASGDEEGGLELEPGLADAEREE